MIKFEDKELNEYYLKKFVQHLVYSSNLEESIGRYNENSFLLTDEFIEAFETEIKLQAYNCIIDKQSKNNILKIAGFIRKQTKDELKQFILDEIIENVLTQNGEYSIDYYHFQLKKRLGRNGYINRMSANDVEQLVLDIRKSLAHDFIVLTNLLFESIDININSAHYIIDSLNVIKIEYPELFEISRIKQYIIKLLTEYKKVVDISLPTKIGQEVDYSLGIETLYNMDYLRTRSREFIKNIK